jgi:hypothetical protein
MNNLVISPAILSKLEIKHKVSKREVEQCFRNKYGNYLEDARENHKTNPPTYWFVSNTNNLRRLKIIFVFKDGNVHLKSAYDCTEIVESLYVKYS